MHVAAHYYFEPLAVVLLYEDIVQFSGDSSDRRCSLLLALGSVRRPQCTKEDNFRCTLS